jgi:hypothetical protein
LRLSDLVSNGLSDLVFAQTVFALCLSLSHLRLSIMVGGGLGTNPFKVMLRPIWSKLDREVLMKKCDELGLPRPDAALNIVTIDQTRIGPF